MERLTNERINRDLLAPLLKTGWRFYAVVLVSGAVVAWALFAWGWQLYHGIGVTGKRRPEFWSLYITNFVFWIGISHARDADLGDPAGDGGRVAAPGDALRRGDYGLRAARRLHVPDHSHGAGVALLLARALPELALALAELPLAADVGLLRDQRLPHRQS